VILGHTDVVLRKEGGLWALPWELLSETTGGHSAETNSANSTGKCYRNLQVRSRHLRQQLATW